MLHEPTLELIHEDFRPALPKNPDGKELTPFEIEKSSFIEGFKLGLRLAAEALIC